MKRREQEVFAHVARVTGASSLVEVASGPAQKREGIESETGVVRGPDLTELIFRERGFDYAVPLDVAQKTGFYFDQRENRALVERLAAGRRVLDAFTYVGAFALAAARGGAERVVALDASAPAITTAAAIAQRHGLASKIALSRADVKKALPAMARENERFDLVVVDPPKLAPSARHLDQGRRAYRKLNANALRLLEPGGVLVTCSCSGALRPSDFLRTVGMAARDARREVSLLSMGQQGPDHPVPVSFPEGRYLKCAILRVS
jgi:23S rRNA (cytosine1962-C5)-methyltransferase